MSDLGPFRRSEISNYQPLFQDIKIGGIPVKANWLQGMSQDVARAHLFQAFTRAEAAYKLRKIEKEGGGGNNGQKRKE
jgi:hypothetical protein